MTTAQNLTRFATLSLPVESELGRCSMSVREVLSLAPGSLIRLSRAVGSPVDLYVGGARFSSGEIVKSANSLAIRIAFDDRKRA